MQDKLKILQDILGKSYRSGKEHLFMCPQPDCEADKNKLSINLEKGFFHCWVCDWSGRSLYRIIKTYGNESHKFKWKNLDNSIDTSDFEAKLFPVKQEVINQRVELPNDFISLTSKRLWDKNIIPVKYLKNRGITYQDVLDWRLGYSPRDEKYGERIIAPSFGLDGYINYFIGRTYSDHYFKYQNADISKNIIFNHLHIDWDKDVILVEGVFDAFKAGINSIPLLGSSLRENSLLFKEIVKNDARVFIALDPDAKKKQVKLINELLGYDIELYEITVPVDRDVGELTKKEFQMLKLQALKVDSVNVFEYNILNKIKELRI